MADENIFFSFILYLAHNRVGRRNLILKHCDIIKILPFLAFGRAYETLYVEWRNSTPRFTSLPERISEKRKYLIFSVNSHTLMSLRHVRSYHVKNKESIY